MNNFKSNKNKQSSCDSQSFLKSLSTQQQEMLAGGTSVENDNSDLICVDSETVAAGNTVRIPVRIKYEA